MVKVGIFFIVPLHCKRKEKPICVLPKKHSCFSCSIFKKYFTVLAKY